MEFDTEYDNMIAVLKKEYGFKYTTELLRFIIKRASKNL